jgi:hypothetical protein
VLGAGVVLTWLFFRGFVLRRWLSPLNFVRFATLWASAVMLCGALAVFHLGALVKLEQVSELLRQGEFRALGSSLPLSGVLEGRRYWLLLAFTPLAIVLGKLAAFALAGRVLFLRRDLELLPLAVLATATLQYVVFKQGADIHFFWPEYFALFFAYGLGALVATATSGTRWALAGLQRSVPTELLRMAYGAVGLLLALAILPDGLRALVYARKTGGRFNEKGLIIQPDFDKAAAFEQVALDLPARAAVGLSSSIKPSYWMDWVLERPTRYVGLPRADAAGVARFLLDARFDSRGALESLTREFPVRAFGPFLVADTEAPAAPTDAYAIVPRRAGVLERWFVASTHDLYDVVPDAFSTWELRLHLGQAPNPAPDAKPETWEDLRIAHNLAAARGDLESALAIRERLLHGLDPKAHRSYTNGVELLGLRFEHGASDRLTLYFSASQAQPTDVAFKLTSFVERAPRWSLVPKDELAWDVGMPFALPTSLWRPNFIYSSVTEILRRPGRERYVGTFRGPQAPVLVEPKDAGPLIVLE